MARMITRLSFALQGEVEERGGLVEALQVILWPPTAGSI